MRRAAVDCRADRIGLGVLYFVLSRSITRLRFLRLGVMLSWWRSSRF